MSKIVDRQYPLAAMAEVSGGRNVGAGNEVTLAIRPGTLLVRLSVVTTVGFNGTTPTLTVTDGTTTFANAVDVATAGAETVTGAPKFYPSAATLTISVAGAGTDTGTAYVVPEYVIANRGNELAE